VKKTTTPSLPIALDQDNLDVPEDGECAYVFSFTYIFMPSYSREGKTDNWRRVISVGKAIPANVPIGLSSPWGREFSGDPWKILLANPYEKGGFLDINSSIRSQFIKIS